MCCYICKARVISWSSFQISFHIPFNCRKNEVIAELQATRYEIIELGKRKIPQGVSITHMLGKSGYNVKNVNLASARRFCIEEYGLRELSLISFFDIVNEPIVVEAVNNMADKRLARYGDLLTICGQTVTTGPIVCLRDSTTIHNAVKVPVAIGQELHLRRKDSWWRPTVSFLLVKEDKKD